MMKFFRKHNKKLLAVFMVLLMVVFLGGTALDSLLQPSGNELWANSRFGPITSGHYQSAQVTTEILGFFYPAVDWQRPVPGMRTNIETIDWVLLTREARRLNSTVGVDQVRATMPDLTVIDDLARRLRRKPSRILSALAEFSSIRQAALTVAGAVIPSQAELASAMRKSMEKVRVNAVALPAVAFVDEDKTFSEEQIQSQFESYREREKGVGLEFGYYVPPAVKVQYIEINRAAIADDPRIPNLEQKAKAFYTENREINPAFRRPGTEAVEGPTEDMPPHLTWEEAKDKAIELVREEEAKEAAARIADWLVQYNSEAWADVDRGEDGYKIAPTRVADLGFFDRILENIPRTIAYPQAVSVGVTEFFQQPDADLLPKLGSAVFVGQQAGVYEPFSKLAFQTKAIVDKVPQTEGASRLDYLAPYQTCRFPIQDHQAGRTFVFRVVDSRAGHVAETVDEVRAQVVEDLRLLDAFATAKARAESLRSCGSSMTLREAYDSDVDLVSRITDGGFAGAGYVEPRAVPRSAAFFAQSGTTPRPYLGPEIGRISLEQLDQCFALEKSDTKTASLELEDRAAVVVVEWVETEYTDPGQFDADRESFLDAMNRARSNAVVESWMNPENIQARNGFTLKTN